MFSHSRASLGLDLCVAAAAIALFLIPRSSAAEAPPAGAQEAPPSSSNQTKSEASGATQAGTNKERSSGTLFVTSDATNGECYLNDKLIARLPMPGPWTLPVGRYQLELRDGSWRSKRAIEIQAGKRLTLDLRRLPAGVAGMEEDGPVEIRYAPPPFPLYETSYGLLGIAALTLGLAAYFHLDATQLAEEARGFGRDQQRSDQDLLVNEAESQLSRARVSYGLSVTTLIGGLSYLLFSKEGLLNQQDGPPPGLFEQSGG